MASKAAKDIEIFGIRGRWGSNVPFGCPPNQVIEALNVDWFRSTFARKRNGATSISLTGGTAQTGVISFLTSHVPSDDQTLREFWSIDDAATPRVKRMAGSSSWADVTLTDAITNSVPQANSCSFNGKLFFCYNSAENRLHVWDPTDATIRRSGLATPAAATVANTGGGTYAATLRYYKVAYGTLTGSTIRVRSNLSASVSFTPSGAGTAARVTKPAAISEGETHWLLYGSSDDSNYVLLATTVVGTTTYDDSATPSLYTGTAAPDPNAFTPWPSVKWLVPDDRYIVGGGAWETSAGSSGAMTPSTRRIWWSSALGATDQGDDERVSNTSSIKNYTDIAESPIAAAVPQQGSIFVWSYNGMWKMVGTGNANAPYLTFRITGAKGNIDHKSVVSAEDENGEACTYWWSPQGPCRVGVGGRYTLVEDISDLQDLINLSATGASCHGVYHRDKHQIWWWIATSGSNDPNIRVVFDTQLGRVVEAGKVRMGWAQHTGGSAAARCSAMMSVTLGAAMSRDLKPYIGRSTGTSIWKCDTSTDDNGTAFQAYVITRPYTPYGLGQKSGGVIDAKLTAVRGSAVSIAMTVLKDFSDDVYPVETTLIDLQAGTHVFADMRAQFANAECIQFQIGDAAAVSNNWNLDAISIPTADHGSN